MDTVLNKPAPIPNVAEYVSELNTLSPLQVCPHLTEAKRDARSHVANYSLGKPGVPMVLIKLVKFARAQIPAGCNPSGCNITFGVYMRTAATDLPGPAADTMFRFLFNFGEEDVYEFTSPDAASPACIQTAQFSNELGINPLVLPGTHARSVVFSADTFSNLGPGVVCNHLLRVSENPTREVTSNAAVRSGYTQRTRKIPRKTSYRRMVVVLDFLATRDEIKEIISRASTAIKQLPVQKIAQTSGGAHTYVKKTYATTSSSPSVISPSKTKLNSEEDKELDAIINGASDA